MKLNSRKHVITHGHNKGLVKNNPKHTPSKSMTEALARLKKIGKRLVDDEEVLSAVGGFKRGFKYFQRAPKYGKRSWKIPGKFVNVIVFDDGNGWVRIQSIHDSTFTKYGPGNKITEKRGTYPEVAEMMDRAS